VFRPYKVILSKLLTDWNYRDISAHVSIHYLLLLHIVIVWECIPTLHSRYLHIAASTLCSALPIRACMPTLHSRYLHIAASTLFSALPSRACMPTLHSPYLHIAASTLCSVLPSRVCMPTLHSRYLHIAASTLYSFCAYLSLTWRASLAATEVTVLLNIYENITSSSRVLISWRNLGTEINVLQFPSNKFLMRKRAAV
jgi:hypothetical protein